MIAQLLRFALRQRFVTLLVGLTLVGAGLWAFAQLKIEAYPDISDVGSSRVDLQACKLEYSIVSPK